mgnify:CR=1 FL=1
MKNKNVLLLLILFLVASHLAFAGKPPKKVFIPLDYSYCGYHASECTIPTLPVVVVLTPEDASSHPDAIQQAIDYLASQPADNNSHRGTILLRAGKYHIEHPIRISCSGIVLRGEGINKTIIIKHGFDRGAAVYIEGRKASTELTVPVLLNTDIPSGAMSIPKGSLSLAVGDNIKLIRPCTLEWINSLAMNDFGGGLDYTGWKKGDIEIEWHRIVTSVTSDSVRLSAPLTCSISKEFGGIYVSKFANENIVECGIENLSIQSVFNTHNLKDEDHCWDGIYVDNASNSWVRHVNFANLSGSAVCLQKNTSLITVEDCISTNPISEIGGWRRRTFTTRGQQCLFQRCLSRQGINDFSVGYCAAGPNAFVQCDTEESFGFSGSVGSWAPGVLFDIVNIDRGDIRFANLEQFQMGTGWNTANSMAWQCTASTIYLYSPDTLNCSSGHGCWGTLTGNAHWTSSNDHVSPRSLFYHQLASRLADKNIDGHLLPRDVNATSSPTVEQAMTLAQESLSTPRLTLAMWIDSLQQISTDVPSTAKSFKDVVALLSRSTGKKSKAATAKSVFTMSSNGVITTNNQILCGNRYAIPWWNGRVKDNYVRTDGRPALTRFVPGREGIGLTDRIDSVVATLHTNGYAMLDHHYGLWYDLRRIDHERIRRADAEVAAPFYEQAFARSGQDSAWDGLSRYDLTQPNNWYWNRLRQYAQAALPNGQILYCQHYFQHNILEAGAHWVDCPWRPVNNINSTDDIFPEPVPFAGDKRIFVAEQFYDVVNNEHARQLHRNYIRMCLDQTADNPNIVHVLSDEYTGPLHFVQFWLDIIAEWEAETGRHPIVALSCTRDAQDAILADERRANIVDIIDIRYWHYNTAGLWAPEAGKNLAPRQWMRKMKVGKTSKVEAYKAVAEYRTQYPSKAVTFFAQQYPEYGWAILMAGGSLPNVTIKNEQLKQDIATMMPQQSESCWLLNGSKGHLIYANENNASCTIDKGKYNVWKVDEKDGSVTLISKNTTLGGIYSPSSKIIWLQKR